MADEEIKTEEAGPSTAPPVAPPPIVSQVDKREGRRWPLLATYLILALVVALGVVFGGRWIYHKVHNKSSSETPAPASNKVPAAPSEGNKQSHKSSTPQKTSNSGGSTSSGTGSQITDTGPGSTIALFVGTSLAAAGLHYIYQLRKQGQ